MAIPQFDTIPNRNLAYLVMRKCGCSSIKQAISQLRDEKPATTPAEIHSHNEWTFRPSEMSNGEDWFTFTIVRDPIMRFLSFYSNKVLDQNIIGSSTLNRRKEYGYQPNMTLDDAIATLRNPAFRTEPHVESMYQTIKKIGFELDYVGRIEAFSKCIDDIKRMSGILLPIQHLNRALHKPLFIDETQFEQLREFFEEDLRYFDYPDNFKDWQETNVTGREEKFQREGFIFEDQARLHRYQVRRDPKRFIIDLFWKIESTQSCKRVIRIVQKNSSGRNVIWHLPPEFELKEKANDDGFLHEKVSIPLAKIPQDIDPSEVFFELYFANKDTARPGLVNYFNHQNMLMFALKETVLKRSSQTSAS